MKRVMLTLIVIYWIFTVLVFYVRNFCVKFRIFLVGESGTDLMYVDPGRSIFYCRNQAAAVGKAAA